MSTPPHKSSLEDENPNALASGTGQASSTNNPHDSHASPNDMGQDTPRSESSDADRRSNVLFRVSTTKDSQSDHVDPENRMELRDSTDNIKDIRVKNRDSKSDTTYDSRIYDNQDVMCEKDTKRELNPDKDAFYSASPLTLKEQHSAKLDAPAARNAETWPKEEGLNVDGREENTKGDDKHKDTDRKRKELKEKDKERSDGQDRQVREEREESDRKNDRGESWNESDKEANKSVELMKNKDTLKNSERDANAESERPDKRIRVHEKESEDVGEGMERERDSGVHQRRRMISTMGSPIQMVKPLANDNEGSLGKSDVSSCVVYNIGDGMQELLKLWKAYEESSTDKSCESVPTLEIRIPAEHVTATNRQVRGGQLWGTDVYTVDSDLVAVLMHTGYCRPTASPPPSAAQELRATIRLLPPKDGYISTLRNNVRSRAWGAAIGCSYRVEHCCIVKKGGGIISLTPCLTHSSTPEPTLAPVAMERKMTTRAAASNALRQQRFVREVTVQFNLCMEPWLKYSISAVADEGLKKILFTSSRLKKGEVLYVETPSRRYELCFNGEKAAHGVETVTTPTPSSLPLLTNGSVDIFRWSRCKRPLTQKMMKKIGIPLPMEHVEVLEENLEWDDISWSQTGAWIGGREYHLARAHFMSTH